MWLVKNRSNICSHCSYDKSTLSVSTEAILSQAGLSSSSSSSSGDQYLSEMHKPFNSYKLATQGNQAMDKQVAFGKGNNKIKSANKCTIKTFETLFGNQIGSNARLIADYSGAILRDMVISGRLYISSSHLCFYGSMLKWETKIVIDLAEISSIVKAKTIKVIPNAIQIITRTGDKYVFASLISRHKVYLTLFSTWTASLSGNLMSYDLNVDKSSTDSSIRKCYSNLESGSKRINDNQIMNNREETRSNSLKSKRKNFSTGDLTDIRLNVRDSDDNSCSNSSNTEIISSLSSDKPIRDPTKCPYSASCLADVVLPVNLDRLFEMLFTDSSFYSFLTQSLKHKIIVKKEWCTPREDDLQESNKTTIGIRQLSRRMFLDYPFAKDMVSEEMIYLEHFEASNYYGLRVVSESFGVPLCSLFNVITNYCLHRTANPSETHFHFHYKTIFKSKAWGFKSLIEDGSKRGCQDFVDSLLETVKKWSNDNPDYVSKTGFSDQLKVLRKETIVYPIESQYNNNTNQTFDDQSSIVKKPAAQLLTQSSICTNTVKEKPNSNQSNINCLSPSINSTIEKSIHKESNFAFCSNCKSTDCDDSHVHNIVKHLKPLIVFLLLLTIANFFLMIRLLDNQSNHLSPSTVCPSNQGSTPSNLIGLSTADETFESLSNYAYPSLGCNV